MSAESAIFNYLDSVVESLRAKRDLFRGPERPPAKGEFCIPDRAVFIWESGGVEPERCFDKEANLHQMRCNVQIIVRGEPNDYLSGKCLADEIHDWIRRFKLSDSCDPQVSFVRQRESCPLYLGRDGSGHDVWSMNLEVGIDLLRKKEC